MASTYSNLKIQLMATGENATTWGDVTNINLGTAIEEAIAGSADVTFASANVTLSLTNTNATQTARNMRLRLTGTTGGARTLFVPSIQKVYIVTNDCADTVTVKTSASVATTVGVPAGKTMWLYCDGTNVANAVSHLSSLTLGTALPITSGGTGTNVTTYCNLEANVSGILPITAGGTGTNAATYCNLEANVSGILPITNGGTGANTASAARTALGATTLGANVFTITNPSAVTFPRFNADNTVSALSASDFRTAIGAGTGSGTVTSVSGTGSANGLSLSGTVTSSGNITLSGSVTSVNASATIDGVTIGYRSIPRSTTTTTATTGDVGKCIAITAGITIPNSTFAAGDAISIYNDGSTSLTITQASGLTLRQAGTTNTGNRTLAARGIATVWFNSSSEAIISGAGVS